MAFIGNKTRMLRGQVCQFSETSWAANDITVSAGGDQECN